MTPSPDKQPASSCPPRSDLVDFALGASAPDAHARLRRHLADCARCRAGVRTQQDLLDVVDRAGADLPPAPADLSQRVLERCEPALARRAGLARRRGRVAGLAAAAIALFVLSLHFVLDAQRGSGVARPTLASLSGTAVPAGWLAARVGPDGGFDAASWQGPRAAAIGMHSLALLALTEAGDDADRDAVRRAAQWLIDRQDRRGAIGSGARVDADHAMATLALIEAAQLTGDAASTAAARAALEHLLASQGSDGGWQPHGPGRPGANSAQTAWGVAALMRADELAWHTPADALAAGCRRLALDLHEGGDAEVLDLSAVRRLALADLDRARGADFGELPAAALSLLAVAATN